MTPTELYALRTTNLLPVPEQVLDIISSMQLAPVAQVYSKKIGFKKSSTHHNHAPDRSASWRIDALVTKKITFKHDDPEYDAINGIINKVSTSTLTESVARTIELIKKRNEDVFRLRVVTLMFNRGVSMPFFSKLIANMFELIHVQIPEIRDDLQFSCCLDSFNKMFDQTETITCPSSSDEDYDDKLCEWTKKREIRRGFGIFVTELHIRGLVDEDVIMGAMLMAADELEDTIKKPNDKTISETVDQLVTLLYETCKIIITRYGKEHPIVKLLQDRSKKILATPKTTTPCLGMRSRFKLEDIQKL